MLLAQVRHRLGLSSREISRWLGVDQRTVTRWEATVDPAEIDGRTWVAYYYFLLTATDLDRELINALPVPSRAACPQIAADGPAEPLSRR